LYTPSGVGAGGSVRFNCAKCSSGDIVFDTVTFCGPVIKFQKIYSYHKAKLIEAKSIGIEKFLKRSEEIFKRHNADQSGDGYDGLH
jgi:hypothetical protein